MYGFVNWSYQLLLRHWIHRGHYRLVARNQFDFSALSVRNSQYRALSHSASTFPLTIFYSGFARAWVRLALEKKLLSSHLKALLSSSVPLPSLPAPAFDGGGGRGSVSSVSSSSAFSPSSGGRLRPGEESGGGGVTPDGLSTPTVPKSAPQETQESLLKKLYKRYAFLRSEVRTVRVRRSATHHRVSP